MSVVSSDYFQLQRAYALRRLFYTDPFESLDVKVVGAVLQRAVNQCTIHYPHTKVSQLFSNIACLHLRITFFQRLTVCGEHCGDANSVRFFDWLEIDAVACPAHLVPTAKIAAAQANLRKTTRMSAAN